MSHRNHTGSWLAPIITCIAALVGCERTPATPPPPPTDAVAADDTAAHGATWDYEQRGPQAWGDLSPDYVLARLGGSQSPVDIQPERAITADLSAIEITGHPVELRILNNGHTVEAVVPGGATLRFGDDVYELRQLHFHAPSEHTIDGQHAEVEIHLVFADGAGHLAVIGVFCEEGPTENPSYIELVGDEQEEIEALAKGETWVHPTEQFHIEKLLPGSLDFWTYDGSLTTPPATEGVRWFVLKEPVLLSRKQIERFDFAYYDNNRPVQPLNARFVLTPR